jgi:uracil-DNA glycosylase family 4
MPSFDSSYCLECPYRNQEHLPREQRQRRKTVPLDVEDHESDILLVFQAPGVEEWAEGKPLRPTRKKGGTAGCRIEQSLERKGKKRESVNITNAVQCFPGNDGGRDHAPERRAVSACAGWLRDAMRAREYRKVIAFGDIAAQVVGIVVTLEGLNCEVQYAPHPTGGVENEVLDALWT